MLTRMTQVDTTGTDTLASYVIAHAKLPDDLAISEFEALVSAVEQISYTALLISQKEGRRTRRASEKVPWPEIRRAPQPVVVRVRYGSDLSIVLQIVGSVAVAASSVAAAFIAMAKALKIIQESRLINEDRLGKKAARHVAREDRLARLREREALARRAQVARDRAAEISRSKWGDTPIEDEVHGAERREREALDAVMSPDERKLADGDRRPLPISTYHAIGVLADYQVELRVEREPGV